MYDGCTIPKSLLHLQGLGAKKTLERERALGQLIARLDAMLGKHRFDGDIQISHYLLDPLVLKRAIWKSQDLHIWWRHCLTSKRQRVWKKYRSLSCKSCMGVCAHLFTCFFLCLSNLFVCWVLLLACVRVRGNMLRSCALMCHAMVTI